MDDAKAEAWKAADLDPDAPEDEDEEDEDVDAPESPEDDEECKVMLSATREAVLISIA